GGGYLAAFAAIGIAGTVGLFFLTPVRSFPLQFDFSEASVLFKFSLPLMLANILGMFLFRIDIFMIGYYL
ncbi:MAG: oligosaccharide flippase family protein, partial [candidate division Zixibacteria bacterium]|nr:oligosaccharide flippase family protein [candidate division Zixibacteria bacterium]NIW39920.1 oligosaccharide flippase family protein [candidate division Zixibacteria bacterium]NIX56773.1 oligosaccharide flippase family protein [candidate division Zixibacteria bacterium]